MKCAVDTLIYSLKFWILKLGRYLTIIILNNCNSCWHIFMIIIDNQKKQ